MEMAIKRKALGEFSTDSEASLITKGMQITKLEVSTLSLQGIMTVYKIININCSPSDLVGTGGPTLKHKT